MLTDNCMGTYGFIIMYYGMKHQENYDKTKGDNKGVIFHYCLS